MTDSLIARQTPDKIDNNDSRNYHLVMKNNIVIAVVIIVAIIGGAYFLLGKSKPATNVENSTESSVTKTPTPTVTTPVSQTPTIHGVSIQNFAFDQKSITIKKGDSVLWTNRDSATHTITGDAGGPNSSNLNKDGLFSYTFTSTGTFNYHCALHPSMTGTVTVTE